MADAKHQPVYRFGEFTLDTSRGVLLHGRDEVSLRPQSAAVLQILLDNHGRLVGKDELHEKVWGQKAVTGDSLVQCVADIRKALNDPDQKILRTMPRRGYLFDGDVSTDEAASGAPSSELQAWVRPAAAAAGTLLAVWLGWSLWVASSQPPSIAVLPLINMSAVAENTYFSEGVHEEILTNLSRVEDLRVISRTTMTRY